MHGELLRRTLPFPERCTGVMAHVYWLPSEDFSFNICARMGKKPLFFYGWVVLAVSFVAMTLGYGARNSFSVFYVVILDEFGWSRASTAVIFSVNAVVYGITAPLAGALVDRFGPKRVLSTGADEEWVHMDWTLRKALRTRQFWLIFLSFLCIFGFAENFVVVHQIALMRDAGFSNSFAASIVAL